ncbi:MAG: hypothetical protein WKG06_34275 [Segetibacter sp.]
MTKKLTVLLVIILHINYFSYSQAETQAQEGNSKKIDSLQDRIISIKN